MNESSRRAIKEIQEVRAEDERLEAQNLLLSCPFCGDAVRLERLEKALFRVKCFPCRIETPWACGSEKAIVMWNTRKG